MTSTKHLRRAGLSLAVLAALQANAGVDFARGTLGLEINSKAEHDSNVFGNNSEKADELLTVIPEITYVRNVGLISVDMSTGVKIQRFSDFTDLNTDDFFAGAKLDYDAAEKGNASFEIGYERFSAANEAVLARTESDEYKAKGSFDYFYSEKLGLRVLAGYTDSQQLLVGFNDVTTYQLGTGALYRYSPKLVANLSYNFRNTATDNVAVGLANPDSNDHRISFGVEGEITPKLTGRAATGIVYREFDTGGDDTGFFADVGLTWDVLEKTSITLDIGNDYNTSAGAQSSENFSAKLGISQELLEKLIGRASISYGNDNYDASGPVAARQDDTYTLSAGLTYTFTDSVSTAFDLSYKDSSSDLATADYERTLVTISLDAKF